jgi:hypothetical protein
MPLTLCSGHATRNVGHLQRNLDVKRFTTVGTPPTPGCQHPPATVLEAGAGISAVARPGDPVCRAC